MRNFFRWKSKPALSATSADASGKGFVGRLQEMIKERTGVSLRAPVPLDQDPVWARGIFYAPLLPPPAPPAPFDIITRGYRRQWEDSRELIAASGCRPLWRVFHAVSKLSTWWHDRAQWEFFRYVCGTALESDPHLEYLFGPALRELHSVAGDDSPADDTRRKNAEMLTEALDRLYAHPSVLPSGSDAVITLLRDALAICLAARIEFRRNGY